MVVHLWHASVRVLGLGVKKVKKAYVPFAGLAVVRSRRLYYFTFSAPSWLDMTGYIYRDIWGPILRYMAWIGETCSSVADPCASYQEVEYKCLLWRENIRFNVAK